jgi:hypothetical protein
MAPADDALPQTSCSNAPCDASGDDSTPTGQVPSWVDVGLVDAGPDDTATSEEANRPPIACAGNVDCDSQSFCAHNVCHTRGLQVAVGVSHACALLADGTVRCWGDNTWGQLGVHTNNPSSPYPLPVVGLTGVTAISASRTATCALMSDGSVRYWGSNKAIGQSPTPTAISGLSGVSEIECAREHICVLFSDGTASCVGEDMGLPPLGKNKVQGISGAHSLVSGFWHACAIVGTGSVRCWGRDSSTNQPILQAVEVPGLPAVVALSAAYHETCALTSSGTVACFNTEPIDLSHQQVGPGFVTSLVPETILSGASIGALGTHACVSGNVPGALRSVAGSSDWGNAFCAIDVRGSLYHWVGLGPDAGAPSMSPPTDFEAGTLSQPSVCGVLKDGSVWCWSSVAAVEMSNW